MVSMLCVRILVVLSRQSERLAVGRRDPGDRLPSLQPRFFLNVATPALRPLQRNFESLMHSINMTQSDEEDNYMNMVFEDAPKGPKYETSLQRAARKRKEVRLFATQGTTQG
jgi:hypothetical protein